MLAVVSLLQYIFCFSDKELITHPLDGLVLPGITRKSLIELARKWVSLLYILQGRLYNGQLFYAYFSGDYIMGKSFMHTSGEFI